MNFCPNCGYHLSGSGLTYFNACPTESKCSWKIQKGGQSWKCSHGVGMTQHPKAYCDGGCCR